MIVVSRVGQHCAFAFLRSDLIYSDSLIVFPRATHAAFCALQSRLHEIWARFFGSSLEDRLRYTPSDVFETFPFPRNWTTHPVLDAAGQAYCEFRADLMVRNNEGLTKTYNRFHDPDERGPDIARLRELHDEMDRAVLTAYGWSDLAASSEFVLDHEIEATASLRRRKPYRYRWPDWAGNEVLARLVEFNGKQAEDKTLPSTRPTTVQL